MDAISFVLGVKATHLRGSQLKDLIFRVEGESARPQNSYVKLVYSSENGEETEFMRKISSQDNDATFHLDGEEKSWEDYNKALANLNIIVQAKNFLVFQVSFFKFPIKANIFINSILKREMWNPLQQNPPKH